MLVEYLLSLIHCLLEISSKNLTYIGEAIKNVMVRFSTIMQYEVLNSPNLLRKIYWIVSGTWEATAPWWQRLTIYDPKDRTFIGAGLLKMEEMYRKNRWDDLKKYFASRGIDMPDYQTSGGVFQIDHNRTKPKLHDFSAFCAVLTDELSSQKERGSSIVERLNHRFASISD